MTLATMVTISTASGADVANDVDNFPLLVRLDCDNFDFSQAQGDGQDLRFSDDLGTPLFYEIEAWDSANCEASIWVHVPTVKGDDSTEIKMYWGNASAEDRSNGEKVFNNGFAGAWHLNGDFEDATANSNDGSNNGTISAVGVIDSAREFDGSNDYISIADDNSLDLSETGTFSLWLETDALGEWQETFNKASAAPAKYVPYRIVVCDDYGDIEAGQLSFQIANGSSTEAVQSTTVVDVDTWVQVVGVADGDSLRIYINGVQEAAVEQTINMVTNSAPLHLGRWSQGGSYYPFDGSMDEVRIASAARSADWIKLSYESQKAGADMIDFAE